MLPSRMLISATAVIFALGGLGMLFEPDGVTRVLMNHPEAPAWPVQLLGAAWCGFAAFNWMSRGTVVGGIYGRPLVAANFVHSLMAALVLGRTALAGTLASGAWLMLVIMALLAAVYGLRLYGGPPEPEFPGPRAG